MAKPIIIKNPTSMQHVVSIKPSQRIELYLSKSTHENPQVLATGNVKVVNMTDLDGYVVYTIATTPHDYIWSFYSSCFLGEVWIHSGWLDQESKPKLAKLCVVLQTSNKAKERVLTVINPDFFDVRIKPFHVLEFIAFDADFSDMDNWTYNWEPKVDLSLMTLGEDEFRISNYAAPLVQPEVDCGELFSKLCRCDRHSLKAKQHHFWFRLSKQVIDLIGDHRDLVHVGDLTIFGHSWSDFDRWQKYPPDICTEYRVSLHLDCDKRYLRDYLETARIRRQTANYPLIPLERRSFSRKKILPSIMDVTITEKNVSDLGDGCRIAPAIPLPIPMQHDPDDDYFDYFQRESYQTRSYRYPPRP